MRIDMTLYGRLKKKRKREIDDILGGMILALLAGIGIWLWAAICP